MGHRPQVRRSLATGSIQNELGNSYEAGLTELARGQVLSPKVDSLDSLDSIDSIESLDSLDSLDSLTPSALLLLLLSSLYLSFPLSLSTELPKGKRAEHLKNVFSLHFLKIYF
jgi:hypothetical protein